MGRAQFPGLALELSAPALVSTWAHTVKHPWAVRDPGVRFYKGPQPLRSRHLALLLQKQVTQSPLSSKLHVPFENREDIIVTAIIGC